MMMDQRILVTGANGLVGQQLVALLSLIPEYDVLATGRQARPKCTGGNFGYTILDITDPAQVREVFLNFAPNVVINCAAMTRVDLCEAERDTCWRINVEAVEHLAKSCKSSGARLIHLSTDFIFDGERGPYREGDRPSPINFYGRSKLASENIVRQLGLQRWSIARTALVFGTGNRLGRTNIALWMLDQLSKGHPIHVVSDQARTPTYAPDLAAGLLRIVRYKKDGVFHLSGREYLSVLDFARLLAKSFDLDASLIYPTVSTAFPKAAPRPLHSGFIILKAETELGFRPRPLLQAFQHLSSQIDLKVSA